MLRLLAYILLSIILHIALIWLCLATSPNSIQTSASHPTISPQTTMTLISTTMETTSEINKSTSEDLPIILPDSLINPVLAVNQKQEGINNKKKSQEIKKTRNKTRATNPSETLKQINKNNNPSINTAVNITAHNNITMQRRALHNDISQINIGEQKQGEHYYSQLKQEIERHIPVKLASKAIEDEYYCNLILELTVAYIMLKSFAPLVSIPLIMLH